MSTGTTLAVRMNMNQQFPLSPSHATSHASLHFGPPGLEGGTDRPHCCSHYATQAQTHFREHCKCGARPSENDANFKPLFLSPQRFSPSLRWVVWCSFFFFLPSFYFFFKLDLLSPPGNLCWILFIITFFLPLFFVLFCTKSAAGR